MRRRHSRRWAADPATVYELLAGSTRAILRGEVRQAAVHEPDIAAAAAAAVLPQRVEGAFHHVLELGPGVVEAVRPRLRHTGRGEVGADHISADVGAEARCRDQRVRGADGP